MVYFSDRTGVGGYMIDSTRGMCVISHLAWVSGGGGVRKQSQRDDMAQRLRLRKRVCSSDMQ